MSIEPTTQVEFDPDESDLAKQTDRDLLLSIWADLRVIKKQIRRIETNQSMYVERARQIALSRNADHVVAQIDAHIEAQEV